MAKVYKLVKKYPGSPEVNTIVKDNGLKYQIEGTSRLIARELVEGEPEYWHEVSEPLFKTEDGIHIFKPGDVVFAVDLNNWTVTPIKANAVVKDGLLKSSTRLFSDRGNAKAHADFNIPKYSDSQLEKAIQEYISEHVKVKVIGGVAYCNHEGVEIKDLDNKN